VTFTARIAGAGEARKPLDLRSVDGSSRTSRGSTRGSESSTSNSTIAEDGVDPRLKIAHEGLEDLLGWEHSRDLLRGIEKRSGISQDGAKSFDLQFELLVGVDTVEKKLCVLRVGPVRVDNNLCLRQRPDQSKSDARAILVPRTLRRMLAQLPIAREDLVDVHTAPLVRRAASLS
jgi:hypothetical protein